MANLTQIKAYFNKQTGNATDGTVTLSIYNGINPNSLGSLLWTDSFNSNTISIDGQQLKTFTPDITVSSFTLIISLPEIYQFAIVYITDLYLYGNTQPFNTGFVAYSDPAPYGTFSSTTVIPYLIFTIDGVDYYSIDSIGSSYPSSLNGMSGVNERTTRRAITYRVPTKATNPTPADTSTSIDTSDPFTLSWEPGDATYLPDSYIVYVGGGLSFDSYETTDTSLTYTGHLFIPTTTWRVDSIYGSTTVTGDEWTFNPLIESTATWQIPYSPLPKDDSTIGAFSNVEVSWKGDYRATDREVWVSLNGATASKIDSYTTRHAVLTGLTNADVITWHVKEKLKFKLVTTVSFWVEGPEWTFTVGSTQQMSAIGNRANYQTLTRVWLSEVGNYDNFDDGTNDADPFSLVVSTQNEVRWIQGLESLLLATAADEWKIASNKLDTPLSPTNFGVKKQSNYGSRDIQAIKINEVILFADFVGRKIRELTWGADVEKYVSPDMSALAEHITETGIVCMAHQKNPDSMLWCVLTDGSLISMVYDREQDVVAWSDHPIDGTVQSVCVVPATNEDEVWISVKRTINSSDYVYIEKMASRIQGDIEDSFFVDSGIVDTGTSATITGLDHLEGETVVALVDGSYDGTFTVSSGSITLNTTPTSKTAVGLAYTAILQPMRIYANGPNGSSLGSLTRVHDLKVNFLNTEGAQYGDSESSLYSFDFTDERLEDAAYITDLFSGDIPVIMEGGFSMENPILISSSQPYPMTVKSIVAGFEQTGD